MLNSKKVRDDKNVQGKLASMVAPKLPDCIVLGQTVMRAVWEDMKRMQLATWVSAAPSNWGTAERGKLSADQWWMVYTIHLPITLIRLWGTKTGRKREMLNHFMDLVSMVWIANMHIFSQNQIKAYNKFIFHYATHCSTLFLDVSLKPVLHAALHIRDMLDHFGPFHAISALFYERYINFFHQLNTNQKIGKFCCQHLA